MCSAPRTGLAAFVAALGASAGATPALAATGFYIHGAGDGHGIGLSQYGSLGFAQHGYTYQQILGHYYSGSSLGQTDPTRMVTVLLHDGANGSFTGATAAGGHKLSPSTTYTVKPAAGGQIALYGPKRKLASFTAPLVVTSSGLVSTGGRQYRGSLQLQSDGSGGIDTINAVDLEDYLRGVVAAEMPSSWPTAALEAQAIAARTYAITAGAAGSAFQVYSDTRSQMYTGVAAETAATDAAIAATRGDVVTVAGSPAVTYFFASSGGQTEDVQDVWSGVSPESWLVGVADPYDSAGGNPYYRWKRSMSIRSASRDLSDWLKGKLRGIQITQRGVSPRIVSAVVVGSRGRTTVSGSQLEQAFSLMSTYASFTTITSSSSSATTASSTPSGSGAATTSSGSSGSGSSTGSSSGGSGMGGPTALTAFTGGATVVSDFRRLTSRHTHVKVLTGSVFPSRPGETVRIERLDRHRFVTVERARLDSSGGYRAVVRPGRYRVVQGSYAGPAVTVR